jgi:hypothetical protein
MVTLSRNSCFLSSKKFNKEGVDIGEKDVSFFLVDPSKESAIDNLHFLSDKGITFLILDQ